MNAELTRERQIATAQRLVERRRRAWAASLMRLVEIIMSDKPPSAEWMLPGDNEEKEGAP
jgi:hypothetical protein